MNQKASIIELLAFNPIHTSHVRALMTYIRELLEANSEKQNYPTLNFYCNWSVHSEITKSSVVADMFINLTRVIADHNSSGGASGDIWAQINELIGVPNFRKEITNFFKKLSIPTSKLDDNNYWKGFTTLLFEKLKDKPLSLADSKKQQQIYALSKSMGQDGWGIDKLIITHNDTHLLWELSCPKIREKNNRLVGPLGLV
jgi:hypothetical protein